MSIDVGSTDEDEFCARCGRAGLMSLKVPASSQSGVVEADDADRRYVLCECCDIDDPAAGALIAFLTVHSPVQPEQANELADYVRAWIASLT